MEIVIAQHSGFCYGVERAVEMVRTLVKEGKGPIHVLGNLIHNPTVVSELAQAGVRQVSSVSEIGSGILVIRSHGIANEIQQEARERNLEIVDTTCPNVKKAQILTRQLQEKGYQIVIVGDNGHAEVEGILSYTDRTGIVVKKGIDLGAHEGNLRGRIGVVCQTTIELSDLREVIDRLVGRTRELVIHNTICDVTTRRQASTRDLAKNVDVMVIVGGMNSANTTRLAQISTATGARTYQVETAQDMNPAWFRKGMKVGLSAGASTPSEITISLKETLQKWEEEGRIG